jgi:uncharacterized protein (DUF4415 family)
MNEPSKTNWDRVDHMTDDEIDTTDSPALDAAFFEHATVRTPAGTTAVVVSIDTDVLAWFRAQGPDYQKRLSAALRIYAAAHQEAA